ncbi:MAG TPA: transcription termination/antitermination NusG family protein [Bryobacteraceae bacterium]|nr:transcription termination/antitermination NusG family protein [Bryobacteraceae bacterium]
MAADNFPWFALRVRSNFENTTSTLLRNQGFDVFQPCYRQRRKWTDRYKEVELPMFPGYTFCRLDLNDRLPVLKTPGVVDLVRFGRNILPVDPVELEQIRRVAESRFAAEPIPFLRVGQLVEVAFGPLTNCQGILIQLKGSSRLVVSVSLLQRSVAVEMNTDWVRPIEPVIPQSLPA